MEGKVELMRSEGSGLEAECLDGLENIKKSEPGV